MARIRTVKPEFYRHEKLQDIEQDHPGSYCMLVFSGLWTLCDSQGVFDFRPRTIKLDILPFLNFDMVKTLDILIKEGFIKQYTIEGKSYGFIPSFLTHQRLSGKEAQDGIRYPKPDFGDGEASVKQQGSNGEIPNAQERKGKGKEGKGYVDGNGENLVLFEKFWELYSKNVGKDKCLEKFNSLSSDDISKIFKTLPTYIASTPEIKYRKNPETYLNNKSWNDIIPTNGMIEKKKRYANA